MTHVDDTNPRHAGDKRLVVVGGGPMLPALVSVLPESVRTLVLANPGTVSPLDVQQSIHYERDDVGRSAAEVVDQRCQLQQRGVVVRVEEWESGAKLDVQRILRGADMAVAFVSGLILFHDWLHAMNEACLDLGLPWTTAAAADGRELHVGPTFVPGKTACFRCYELRYKSNQPLLDAYLKVEAHVRAGAPAVDFGLLPSLPSIAASLLAKEVEVALRGETPRSLGALLTIETPSFRVERHPVLKLPRCSSCSPVQNAPEDRAWR